MGNYNYNYKCWLLGVYNKSYNSFLGFPKTEPPSGELENYTHILGFPKTKSPGGELGNYTHFLGLPKLSHLVVNWGTILISWVFPKLSHQAAKWGSTRTDLLLYFDGLRGRRGVAAASAVLGDDAELVVESLCEVVDGVGGVGDLVVVVDGAPGVAAAVALFDDVVGDVAAAITDWWWPGQCGRALGNVENLNLTRRPWLTWRIDSGKIQLKIKGNRKKCKTANLTRLKGSKNHVTYFPNFLWPHCIYTKQYNYGNSNIRWPCRNPICKH